ncbi:MAG: SH3 domain-containing protein [Elusimicrobiota bacterium]
MKYTLTKGDKVIIIGQDGKFYKVRKPAMAINENWKKDEGYVSADDLHLQ